MVNKNKILKYIEWAANEGWLSLDLSGNELTSVPPEIAKLTKLTSLDLSRNQLTSLPVQVTTLTNLTTLNLNANKLTSLPPEITTLTKLTSFYLIGNQLTSLPPEIATLTNLTSLSLGRNQLTSLPPEIATLTNLTSLNLNENKLTSLPPEITKLSSLTSLDLLHNQLPIPPETLANSRAVKAIFAAITGLESGERLNEAKMLVVGEGKVGKSSVVERLIHGTFNPKKPTTLGVEISDEMKVVQSEVKGEGDSVKTEHLGFRGAGDTAFNAPVFSDHAQPLPAGARCTKR